MASYEMPKCPAGLLGTQHSILSSGHWLHWNTALVSDAMWRDRSQPQGAYNLQIQWTLDLTDGSTYRLFELQTSLAAKFRFDLQRIDLQTGNKTTKMEQKRPVTDYSNRFSMHCRSIEPRPTNFSTCSHCSNTD